VCLRVWEGERGRQRGEIEIECVRVWEEERGDAGASLQPAMRQPTSQLSVHSMGRRGATLSVQILNLISMPLMFVRPWSHKVMPLSRL
jgi:hypothetical protein